MIAIDEHESFAAYAAPDRELAALTARYVEVTDLCKRQQAEIKQLRSLLSITCTLILEIMGTFESQDSIVVKAFQDTLSIIDTAPAS